MSDPIEQVSKKIDQIETALQSAGAWQHEPLSPDAFEHMGAFGIHTMTLEQWLQFVFIPRVREIIKTHEPFPDESMVGAHAIREWDGRQDRDELIRLLIEFDALFDPAE